MTFWEKALHENVKCKIYNTLSDIKDFKKVSRNRLPLNGLKYSWNFAYS